MTRRIISLTVSLALALSLTGCGGKKDGAELSPEERTERYVNAIESARSAEDNEYRTIISSADDEGAQLYLDLMGLDAGDMSAFALSASAMNVQAYGIATVYPAAGKDEAVLKALNGFVDQQKSNFEQYLADQYDVANNARLETLEDGTILLVMCEGQDAIFDSIKDAIEAKGK